MPNVQQKKFGKGGLITLAFTVAMIAVIFLKLDFWYKVSIEIALILLFILVRIGYIYFYLAALALKRGKYEKVWKNMEKALRIGVDYERQVSAGACYVQNGDAERGIEILEKVINSPKAGAYSKNATIVASMGYWRLGQQQKAIDVLMDLKNSGYRNDNLSINLESYLLETGQLKAAKQAINDGRRNNTENNGLLDNRGWYEIQMGHWQNAKEIYKELIDDRNAQFPEAYLHGAQVSIHYGDIDQALERLGWGTSKRFAKTCLISKDYIEGLIHGLENPDTRADLAKAIDANAVDVSCGRPFSITSTDTDTSTSTTPTVQPQVIDSPDSSDVPDEDISLNVDDSSDADSEDLDDREPNTELTDDDEIIAKGLDLDEDENQDAEANEGDEELNTDVDDEDDREPNTDLDE